MSDTGSNDAVYSSSFNSQGEFLIENSHSQPTTSNPPPSPKRQRIDSPQRGDEQLSVMQPANFSLSDNMSLVDELADDPEPFPRKPVRGYTWPVMPSFQLPTVIGAWLQDSFLSAHSRFERFLVGVDADGSQHGLEPHARRPSSIFRPGLGFLRLATGTREQTNKTWPLAKKQKS